MRPCDPITLVYDVTDAQCQRLRGRRVSLAMNRGQRRQRTERAIGRRQLAVGRGPGPDRRAGRKATRPEKRADLRLLDWTRTQDRPPERIPASAIEHAKWYWCDLCECPQVHCPDCDNASCTGGGCDACHDYFTAAIKRVNEGTAPTKAECHPWDEETKDSGRGGLIRISVL